MAALDRRDGAENQKGEIAIILKTYNGYHHSQRMRALAWLKAEYAAGRRQPPIACEACGQTEGPIQAHSEDYSEPFGQHIRRYRVCYRCHMMIHCKFKNAAAWETYKRHLHEGRIFLPIGRNFHAFCKQSLAAMGHKVPFKQGPTRNHIFLDDLR